jgi:hypothetical protein
MPALTLPKAITKQHAKVDRKHLQPKIYIAQAGDDGPVKIGVSGDPVRRIKQLNTGSAVKIVLIGFFVCNSWLIARILEASVHAALAASRLNGEWFSVAPDTARRTIAEKSADLGYVVTYVAVASGAAYVAVTSGAVATLVALAA